MASLQKRGRNYFIRYRDECGKQKTVKGGPDKSVAEQIKRDKESEICAIRAGSLDAKDLKAQEAERRPVAEHAADWHAYLLSKACTPQHADQSRDRALKLIKFARITRVSGLTIGTIQTALGDLRKYKGRARRERLSDGTLAAYARAIKSFSRWLWRDGRTRDDALVHMSLPEINDKAVRRALTAEEAAILIANTRSQPTRSGMTGEDRSVFYSLALGTGFRLRETLSLTPESFDLGGDPPTITCRAEKTKNRKLACQPILPELAETLRPWLACKPAGVPVLSVCPYKAASILRQDLEAAGVEDAESYDFHALRHSYITMVVKSGCSVKVAQELARHSDPKLTLNVYSHLGVHDLTQGLTGLVRTVITPPVQIGLTGTDGGSSISSPGLQNVDPSSLADRTSKKMTPRLNTSLRSST
jgi:integrase